MATPFDQTVGRVAGAIYNDIRGFFPHPPLMLIPAVTFRVRRVLEPFGENTDRIQNRANELADNIQVAVLPVLLTCELDAHIIEKIAPKIRTAAQSALQGDLDD